MKYSYFILMCILLLIDLTLIALSLPHRKKPAVSSFIAMLILCTIAHGFYGASLVITHPQTKFFVHELKFFGVAFFATAFYKMYMDYFGKPGWATKKHIVCLSLVPAAAAILAATNTRHHLFREALWVVENDYGSFVGVQSGILFWIYIAYLYSVFLFSIFVVTRIYIKTPKLYRMQIHVMIFAAIATLVCNFISISGILFEDFGDATLIIFGAGELIQFYGLILYKPVRMIRMARGMAFEEIKDPAVVFDYHGKLLDYNGAAAALFGFRPGEETDIDSFLADKLSATAEELARPGSHTRELYGHSYTLSLRRISDEEDVFTATALVMSDMTELLRRERELEDMAYIDRMTGVANRQAYIRALAEVGGDDLPLTLVRLNVSGMKLINSIHGSEAGDVLIKSIAEIFRETVGDTGLCARIEGDEFALLLRHTDEEEARRLFDRAAETVGDILLVGGFAVMRTTMENINIVDKAAVDSLSITKLLGHSSPAH